MTTSRAAALYIGALLGPSLLIVPGLAAALAGPASIVDWVGLLALSGLFAWVFTALGRRVRERGGITAYVRAGFGDRAARVVGCSFLVAVVLGAPVVCLAGGAYVAPLFGGGTALATTLAAALLAVVVLVTLFGARSSTTVQLGLVVVLVALVVVAVAGSAGQLNSVHWTPFAPHGLGSIGRAATVLMLSFIGWEAIASMVGQLRDPDRQLPRVITIAFAVTSVVYLAVAFAIIGVLGTRAAGPAPLADLLRIAVGPVGAVLAAVVAVALVLAATNAYINGAADLAQQLWPAVPRRAMQAAVAVAGVIIMAAVAVHAVTLAALVTAPTSLFLTVYLGCTAAAARVLRGAVRWAAVVACGVTAIVLAFASWSLLVVAAVVLSVFIVDVGRGRPMRRARVSRSPRVVRTRRRSHDRGCPAPCTPPLRP